MSGFERLEHDAVIFVNPNSPTGVYCESMHDIVKKISQSGNPSSNCRMIWVDETQIPYINYIPNAKSMEQFCSFNS